MIYKPCGISATISARGQILAKRDHYNRGPRLITAGVPVYTAVTPFARFGHSPALVTCVLLLATALIKTPNIFFLAAVNQKLICSVKQIVEHVDVLSL